MAALTANSRHIKLVPWQNGTDYYSYNTIVGRTVDGTLYLTTQKYSVTTSRHIRKFAYEHNGPVEYLDPQAFRELAGITQTDLLRHTLGRARVGQVRPTHTLTLDA